MCILLLWKQAGFDDPEVFKATGSETCIDMAKSWRDRIIEKSKNLGKKRKGSKEPFSTEPKSKKIK